MDTIAALLTVIIVLVVLGVVIWAVEQYVPMSPPFRVAIRVVVVLGLLLWLLRLAGLWRL